MTDLIWDASMLLLAEAVPPSVPVLTLELASGTCLHTEPDQVTDLDFFLKTNPPPPARSLNLFASVWANALLGDKCWDMVLWTKGTWTQGAGATFWSPLADV